MPFKAARMATDAIAGAAGGGGVEVDGMRKFSIEFSSLHRPLWGWRGGHALRRGAAS